MSTILQLYESVIELMVALLKFAFEFLEVAYAAIPKTTEGYRSKFGNSGTILSRREKGFCLTGNRNLSRRLSFQNALAIGGTGSGKSVLFFYRPCILCQTPLSSTIHLENSIPNHQDI